MFPPGSAVSLEAFKRADTFNPASKSIMMADEYSNYELL